MTTPAPHRGTFISSSGTSAGKTFVARAVSHALSLRGLRVAALKPIETGCQPEPLDATGLAKAVGRPELAHAAPFYRAALPLTPYAVQLATGQLPPDLTAIEAHTRQLAVDCDWVVVEGAGGLLAPLDRTHSIADLIARLAYPMLLVAPDRLGVLSHVLTVVESALARRIDLAGIVLTQLESDSSDSSGETNAFILRERLGLPVVQFPMVSDDDSALAAAATSSGLLELLGFAQPSPISGSEDWNRRR